MSGHAFDGDLVYVPPGVKYALLCVSILKAFIAATPDRYDQLQALEEIEKIASEVLRPSGDDVAKALDAMPGLGSSLIAEALKLPGNMAYGAMTGPKIFNALIAINPSLRTASLAYLGQHGGRYGA